jgi:long-chain acyl-CoA synthetase
VVSAAAVGVPDLRAGEAITLFVTLRPGSGTTPETIMNHCREKLAKYMVPESVRVIAKMPLNSNGKIVKADLRRQAET